MFISTTLIFLLTLALTPVLEAASSAAQRSLCTQMLCLVNAYRNQYGAPFLALSEYFFPPPIIILILIIN